MSMLFLQLVSGAHKLKQVSSLQCFETPTQFLTYLATANITSPAVPTLQHE